MNKEKSIPYLFCIGAQKSGTSYLYQLLKQHEEICFSKYKETQYFSDEKNYRKGFDNFYKLFVPNDKTKYIADFTPEYLPDKEALKQIVLLGKERVKIIILLRDPTKRAFSHYNMQIFRGKQSQSFEQLVDEEIIKKQELKSIIGRGLYERQLDMVFEIFDSENIFIETFEYFINNKEDTVNRIIEFLNIISIKDINYDVFVNSRHNTKVVGIGRLFFRIPIRIRRYLFDKSKFIERAMKSILGRSQKKVANIKELNDETAKKLKKYYSSSNQAVCDKYGVDINEWK